MTLMELFEGGELPFSILNGINELPSNYDPSLDYLLMLNHGNKEVVSYIADDLTKLDGFFNMLVTLWYPKWLQDIEILSKQYGVYNYIEEYDKQTIDKNVNVTTTNTTNDNLISAYNSDSMVNDSQNTSTDSINLNVDKNGDTMYTKKVNGNVIGNLIKFLKVNNDYRLHNIMINDLVSRLCLKIY